MENLKVYVDVNVQFSKDGDLIPRSFIWEDGTTYEIDRVTPKKTMCQQKGWRCMY